MTPNKKDYIETGSIIAFLLLMSFLSYFLMLNNVVTVFVSEKEKQQNLINVLLQKKALCKKDRLVKKSLLLWQQKNPMLYNEIKQSSDYLASEITTLIQNTGFSIVQIQPVLPQNTSKKDRNLFLEATLKGNYFLLFYLIEAIDQNPWPTQLIDIKIKSKNQLQLRFALRDRNE